MTGIDIIMRTVSSARVSGRLTVAEGIELRSGVVALSPESSDGANIGAVLGAQATPANVFTFPSVKPGTYRVRAQASATGVAGRLFGSFVVTVGHTDVSNLVLSLSPGALLEGRIELEPRGGTPVPTDLSGFIVSAPMADGTLTRGTTSAPTRPDGTFLFDSPPGPRGHPHRRAPAALGPRSRLVSRSRRDRPGDRLHARCESPRAARDPDRPVEPADRPGDQRRR